MQVPHPKEDHYFNDEFLSNQSDGGDDLEREMQQQMEEASVSESVDSARYSYRANRSTTEDDLLAISGRGVMDESYSAHLQATAAKWGKFQSKREEEEISLSGSRATTLDGESERSGLSSSTINSKGVGSLPSTAGQQVCSKDYNQQLPKKNDLWEEKLPSKLLLPSRDMDLLGLGDALQPLGDTTKAQAGDGAKEKSSNPDTSRDEVDEKSNSFLDLSHNDHDPDNSEDCWKDESYRLEPVEAPRKRKIPWLALAVGILVALAASLFGFGTMFGRKNPNAESSGVPACNNLSQQNEGRMDLILQNVTAAQIQERINNLEDLLLRAYNSASGGCEGLMARVVTSVSMLEVEPLDAGSLAETSSLVRTRWKANVNCRSCPDEEPLFAQPEDSRERHLQSTGWYKNDFQLYEAPQDSIDMILRLLDTFDRLLTSTVDLESAEVVTLATLTATGEVHQAMDWPLDTTTTVTINPTMYPTFAPTTDMGDSDDDFTFALVHMPRAGWVPVQGYEDIKTGMTINKYLLPAARNSVAFRVNTSSPDIPGVTISLYHGASLYRHKVAMEFPAFLDGLQVRHLYNSYVETRNQTLAYTLSATPFWYEVEPVSNIVNITRMGKASTVSFFVDWKSPTAAPTPSPTIAPTISSAPSISSQPTSPTAAPTVAPSLRPTVSASPTSSPSASPTWFWCGFESFKLVDSISGDIIREIRDGSTIDWNQLNSAGITNVTLLANTIPQEVAAVRWYENGKLTSSFGKYLDGVLWDGQLGASQVLATPTDELTIKALCEISLGSSGKHQSKYGHGHEVKLRVVR